MNADIHLEHRAGSSQGKHEGEPSLGLCDRLNRTRDNSQRQLPTTTTPLLRGVDTVTPYQAISLIDECGLNLSANRQLFRWAAIAELAGNQTLTVA